MRLIPVVLAATVLLIGACGSVCTAFEWQVEPVTHNMSTSSPSLAVGADGAPHISFYDATSDIMRYAYRAGDVWRVETIQAMSG